MIDFQKSATKVLLFFDIRKLLRKKSHIIIPAVIYVAVAPTLYVATL